MVMTTELLNHDAFARMIHDKLKAEMEEITNELVAELVIELTEKAKSRLKRKVAGIAVDLVNSQTDICRYGTDLQIRIRNIES